MEFPLLTTKLFIPPPNPRRVVRQTLIDRLNIAVRPGVKLILVSAPPGFGKTTLLSEWVSQLQNNSVAWLSIDEADNQPDRFMEYLCAAIQTIHPDLAKAALTLLKSPLPSGSAYPFNVVVTTLINDLARYNHPISLVLDDYHLIESQEIHSLLGFLIENLPPLHCIVVATRTDPPFSLPRLRARGQVIEFRAQDLRFNTAEISAFLQLISGLEPPSATLNELEKQTEGWIAGLQLIALSTQGKRDLNALLSALSGSNRYILDYLIDEVLELQPPKVVSFLLRTSILKRMNAALCAFLCAEPDAQSILSLLETTNLFIVPLDSDREWYRYYHLFAEFLRNRLHQLSQKQQDNLETELHQKASVWLRDHGFRNEAIEHALLAQDFNLAADILEVFHPSTFSPGSNREVIQWLELIPEEYFLARPLLCLTEAWAYLFSGEHEIVTRRVNQALGQQENLTAQIEGEAATIIAYTCILQNDFSQAIQFAESALEKLPEREKFLRTIALLNLGMAQENFGSLSKAIEYYKLAHQLSQPIANQMLTVSTGSQLADAIFAQGNLDDAACIFQEIIDQLGESGQNLPMAGIVFSRLAQIHYEWNNLEIAEEFSHRTIELGKQWDSVDIVTIGLIFLAKIRLALRDPDEAHSTIKQAEKMVQEGNFLSPPSELVSAAHIARIMLSIGETESVESWLQAFQPESPSYSDFFRETQLATWVRIRLAQGKLDHVNDYLEQQLQAAISRGYGAQIVELLALKALLLDAQGRKNEALIVLSQALDAAQPQNFTRTFVNEGAPMVKILQRASEKGIQLEYVQSLLKQFPEESAPIISPVEMVEALSERELEVLQLIAAGYANQEIADKLIVAVSTIKTHINNIYGKLGVRTRLQAVERARSLKLI